MPNLPKQCFVTVFADLQEQQQNLSLKEGIFSIDNCHFNKYWAISY
jgi:hypothetical protein